ncbi:hypothetical protein ACQCSV_17575 [Pseudarthrobacter sp. S3]|uniref:hypothetical protein n=1 Tax=Pseudarthrobacter sp. S3 TaxID=3418419 RepID=UPI003CEDC9D7
MTFENTDSITLKIWDRSAIEHTLESIVHDLSVKANTTKCRIAVHCSGPNTFTVSVRNQERQLATA